MRNSLNLQPTNTHARYGELANELTVISGATLYEHQKSAVKFALRLLLPPNGGDALSSISGAGCALLMEM